MREQIVIDGAVHVRWTPSITMDPAAHIRSTWRGNPTKPLSSKAIFEYMLLGKYGPEYQARAKAVLERRNGPQCKVHKLPAPFRAYDYLPSPGNYCRICVAVYRERRDKDRAEAKALREALNGGYKYE